MELKLYSQNGTEKAVLSPNTSSVQRKEVPDINELSLSFTLYEFVDIDVNDYIDFMGERYWSTERYLPMEKSTVEWEYNVKLYGIESLIKRFLVLKDIDGEKEAVFSLTARPIDHMRLIVQSINAGMGGDSDFEIGDVEGTDNVVIDYKGKYCDAALNELADAVGTEWWIEGRLVHLCRCEYGEELTIGYGNGLTNLDRDMADNAKFYTRLFPIGSSRNIDPEVYGHSRLQLPNGAKYVDVNTERYGIIHHYEQEAFADIYPRYIGTVSHVRHEEVTGSDGNPFTIYYFQDDGLNFDPNDYEIGGLVKRVSFQEGSELAGLGTSDDHYFEVNYNSTTHEFEIITIWPYDDDTQLPGGTLVPEVGDNYILWNIRMPQEYNRRAELEFEQAVNEYNAKHVLDVSIYKGPTDHVWVEEKEAEQQYLSERPLLYVGRRVRLESGQYFPETGYRCSRITKITRKVTLPSQVDIEIGDALSKGFHETITESVDKRITEQATYLMAKPFWEEYTNSNGARSLRLKDMYAGVLINGFLSVLGSITSLNGIRFGKGGNYGIDGNGDGVLRELTVDKLTATVAHFFELIIDKIKSVGGQIIVTPANAEITRVVEVYNNDDEPKLIGWKCYWPNTDGDKTIYNEFEAGDQVVCASFNQARTGHSENISNKFYWRLCVETGIEGNEHFIFLDADKGVHSDYNGIPEVGDNIVQLGYNKEWAESEGVEVNTDRQNAIIISAYNHNFLDAAIKAPSFTQYAGIEDFSLEGYRLNVISPSGNEFRGTFRVVSGADIEKVGRIVYKSSPIRPDTPTGTTIPPVGWSTEPKDEYGSLPFVLSYSGDWTDIGEYGWKSSQISDEQVTRERVTFRTTGDVVIYVRLTSDSEGEPEADEWFDIIGVGNVDVDMSWAGYDDLGDGNDPDYFAGRCAGQGKTVVVQLKVTGAGPHFFDVLYWKDSGVSVGGDYGTFKVLGGDILPIWASVFDGIQTWSVPVRWNGTDGKSGQDGTSPIVADLSNEIDAVACNADGKTKEAYDKYVYVNLWKGDESQVLTQLSASASPSSGVTVDTDMQNKRVHISIASGTTVAEKTVVTISLKADGISTRTLYFTLNGVRAGEKGGDAVIWSLVPSVSGIVKRKDGSTEPADNITCAVTKNVGGTQSTPAASEYTLNRYIDGVKQSSYAATPPASVGSSLKFELVVGGKVVDVETIPVVADGTDASQVRPNMLLRTVFEQGLDRIGQKWDFAAGSVRIDTSHDARYIQGRQTIRISSRIDASSGANRLFVQSMLGKIKPDTWYTMSFYCFASRQFLFYINLVKNGIRTAIYDGNLIVDGVSKPPTGDASHNDVSFDGRWAQTYHTVVFKTNNAIDSSVTELDVGFYMSYSEGIEVQDLVLGCLKLEEGQGATYYLPNEEDLVGSPAYITVKGGCMRSSGSTYGGVTTYDGNALNTISSSDPEGAWVNESDHSLGRRGARGLALVTIHRTTFAVGVSKYYDTYSSDAYRDINCNALATAILNVSSDYFICLFSNDAVGWNDNLVNALKACGSNGVENTDRGRFPFAFIGQNGLAQGYAFQAHGALEDSVTADVTAYVAGGVLMKVHDGNDAVVYKLTPVVEQALVSRDKELTVNLQYKLLRYEGDASTDYGFSGFFIECTVGSTSTGIGQAFVISDKLASLSKTIDGLYSGSPLFYTVSLYYGNNNHGVLVDRRTVPVTMAANVVFEVGEDSIRSAVTQVSNIKNYFGFNRGILNYPVSGSEACQLYPYGYGLACWSGLNRVYNLGLGTEDNNSTWTLYFEARANSNLNVNVNFCGDSPDTINGESGGQVTLNTSWQVFRCVWSEAVSDVTGSGLNGYIDFEQSGTSLFYIRKICLVKGVKPMLEFVKADEDLTYSGGLQNFQWNIVATLYSEKFMGMNVYKNPCKLNNPTVTYQWSGSWTKSGNTYTSNTISHGGKTIERINVTTARADIKIRITAHSESGYGFVAVGKANASLANETASTIKGSSNIVGYASGDGVTKEVTLSFWGNGFFELIYAKDSSTSSYEDCGTVEIVEVSIPYMDFFTKTIDIKNKTPYTLSFWAKASVDNVVISSFLYESSWSLWRAFGTLENMTSADGSCYTILSTEWKHYTVHWYPNVEAITGTDASKKLIKNIIGCRLHKMDSPYGNNNADIYLAGVTFQEGWIEDGQSTMAFQTSEIKQTADEISSTVQTLVPTVDGLTESVSEISQTSDRIAATVDNMKIGGRNLVLNGAFNYGNKYWFDWGSPTTREIVSIGGRKWMHIVTTTDSYQGYSQNRFDKGIIIRPNTKYTVSFLAYRANNSSISDWNISVGIHWLENGTGSVISQDWYKQFLLTTTPKQYSYTFTSSADSRVNSFNLMIGQGSLHKASGREFYITNIQFEEGTMPTDWRESIEENHSLIEQTATEIKLEVEGELGECGIDITEKKITLNGDTEVNGMLTLNDDTQGFKVTGNGGNTYITPKTIGDESAWSNRAAIDITCTRNVSKFIVEDTLYYQGVFTSVNNFGYAKSGSELILKNHSLSFQQKGYSPITPVMSGTTKTYTKYYIYIGSSTTPIEVTVNGTTASSITIFTISSGGNVKVVQEVHGVFSKQDIHTSSSQSSPTTIPEMVCTQSYVATMPTGTVESVIGYDGLGVNFGNGKYVYIGQESAVFKFGGNGLKVTSSGVQRLADGNWLDINKMYVKRISSSYTVTDTDGVGMIVGTSNTTALTVTLPSPGNNTGRKIYIKPLGSAGMKVAASTACIVDWSNRSNAVSRIADLSEGLQVFMSDGQYWYRGYFGD